MDETAGSTSSNDTGSDAKAASVAQFGANAAAYATSTVHAKGASLDRLVELVAPQPGWYALDIATAAGHTAFAFAPHVRSVVASDLTPQMLTVAAGVAAERGIDNVTFEHADAEALPFADGSFDLVTCRIAPHHFPHPDRFIAEAFRVLRPGGVFGLVDNVVPDPVSAEAVTVGAFANAWEKKRDTSHARALPMQEWRELIESAGGEVVVAETAPKRMVFTTWADRMQVPAAQQTELLAELREAGPAVHAFLAPDFDGECNGTAAEGRSDTVFHLTEGLIVARRPA